MKHTTTAIKVGCSPWLDLVDRGVGNSSAQAASPKSPIATTDWDGGLVLKQHASGTNACLQIHVQIVGARKRSLVELDATTWDGPWMP
jgi:hypothetical protein